MSQQSQSDANGPHRADEVPHASPTSAAKPTPLFTAGHEEQAKEWPSEERRQAERRTDERREAEDRRDSDRRDDERRSADERRTVEAPVDDPEFKLEDGGLWPSLDWRPGNRKLEDRRDSERRADERRAGRERRQRENRRRGDRRQDGNLQSEAELNEDYDDLAEAGDYKGGLD